MPLKRPQADVGAARHIAAAYNAEDVSLLIAVLTDEMGSSLAPDDVKSTLKQVIADLTTANANRHLWLRAALAPPKTTTNTGTRP